MEECRMHSNCKQNIYEFTEICCNVLNFSLAHKSAQLFMGVAALIEPQAVPPSSPDYPLFLTPSLSSCFLLSVLSACLLCCYFRYKLSAHIFAVLPIFNYTSCNMYRSPRTPLSLHPCLWHLQPLRIGALLCAMRRTVALSAAPAVAPVTAFHYCTSTYTII